MHEISWPHVSRDQGTRLRRRESGKLALRKIAIFFKESNNLNTIKPYKNTNTYNTKRSIIKLIT